MTVTTSSAAAPALGLVKAAAGLRISVCIPARNEAATVAGVVAPVLPALEGPHPLVDEIVVVDDGSTDGTGAVAQAAGARVVPRLGPPGKGAAMVDGVRASTGHIVVFLDADVRNVGPHFVTRLLEPLLLDRAVVLAKAAYERPAGATGGGGRVTELLARPLLRRLFPELAFLRQPLAGEVAVRREALAELVLEPGYGVEIAMLIDVGRRYGAEAIVEVDLGRRIHRNRPLDELSGQADEVLAAVLSRTGAGGG